MPASKVSDQKILARFKKCLDEADEFWGGLHSDFKRFKRFTVAEGGQWTNDEKNRMGEPLLETNLLLSYCNQVVNTAIQQEIGCIVEPRSFGASTELALVRQAQLLTLWNRGHGNAAAGYALREQVWGGYGVIYPVIEYSDRSTFNKRLCWKALEDPTRFRCDPSASAPALSDMSYSIVDHDLTKAGFTRRYGSPDRLSREASRLFEKEGGKQVVYEFWVRHEDGEDLFALEDGNTIKASEYKGMPKSERPLLELDEEDKPHSRKIEGGIVEQILIGNDRVLKRIPWPGRRIPHKVAEGRVVWLDGRKSYQAMTTQAMNPQRKRNFLESQKAALYSKGPLEIVFVPAEGYTGELSTKLAEAARNGSTNVTVIPYKSLDENGNQLPPPNFKAQLMGDPVLLQETEATTRDIEMTFGMSPMSWITPDQGASGKAMQVRDLQGQTSNFDFPKNWQSALEETFRDVLEMLPDLGISMQVKLAGTDQKERVAWVNGGARATATGMPNYDLDPDEEYALQLRVAPSEKTMKEMAFNQINQMAKVFPGIAMSIPDLAIRAGTNNLLTEAMATRAYKSLPPGLKDDAPDPQVQALGGQLQQAHGVIQSMQEQLRGASEAVKSLASQLQIEKAKRGNSEAVAAMEASLKQMELAIKEQETKVDAFKAETDRIKAESERLQVVMSPAAAVSSFAQHEACEMATGVPA